MNDEAIQEIRSVRRGISKEFGHNPQKYIDYLKNQNVKYSRQIELYRKLCEHRAELPKLKSAAKNYSEPDHALHRTAGAGFFSEVVR